MNDLLAALPMLGVLIGLMYLVGLPAAIRRGFWIRPQVDALALDEAVTELNRPELAAASERLDRLMGELSELGFYEIDRFVVPNFASRCCVVMLLAYDSRTETTAGAQLVFHGEASDVVLQPRGEFYGLTTRYDTPLDLPPRRSSDAVAPTVIQTTTSPQMFPPPRDVTLECVDWMQSVAEVHATHRRHCEALRPPGARPVSDPQAARELLLRRHARTLARAVEDGYLQPETPGLLRLTARGSLRVASHLMWPLAPATKARQRMRTKRRIAAWG